MGMASFNLSGFNVGTDVSVTISDIYGDVFPADLLGHLMEFDSEAEDTELKIIPITNGGRPIYQTIPGGHSGNMMFTRVNGNFQAMVNELYNAYHDVGLITQLSITANVLNRDGTVDEYLWSNAQLKKPRFGNFHATKEVDMRLGFSASVLTITGGASAFLTGLAAAAA
jgi:hypothetical protein